MRALIVVILLAQAVAPAAWAHAGQEHARATWSFEPWVVISLIVACALYATGCRRLWRRGRVGLGPPVAFALGIASLVAALLSPIDTISADLFSVHMVQHLLLMLVAAPLFVASRPMVAFLWGFPRRIRKAFGHFWGAGFGACIHVLTTPVAVWLAYCGLFAFWHLPGPYAWALRHEVVHILEHVCFFVSAFAFWSVVIEPSGRRRLDYGATLLFVATAAVLGGMPGALMVLTSRPFYAVHADGAARWGMTLLEDQYLAGLIMWIPAGFAYLAAIMALFALWLRAADQRARVTMQRWAGAVPLLLLIALTACDRPAKSEAARGINAAGLGDAKAGAEQIAQIGCGSCHTIPGIVGADGLVGPPLNQMGRRVYLAGLLRNTPDNMALWLRNPQKIVPGNAMPDMGLDEQEARNITAYLYTLR